MGCDIHIAIERKVGSRWVMVNRISYMDHAVDRNYDRFAKLAGVRGDGPRPKGLPDDISESTKLYYGEKFPDAHSASWIELGNAAQLWLSTERARLTDFAREYPESYYFNIDTETHKEPHRLVFWFDN